MILKITISSLIVLILVACSPQTDTITTVTDNAPIVEAEVVAESEASSYNAPEWASIPLVNASTGETFTLADLEGKVIMVHAMATWCSNCRQQQGNIRGALPQLSDEDVVIISMSVENNLENARLAEYAENNQFGWTFVVAPNELLVALVAEFGRTITNPPATPRFYISADGTLSPLVTGFHSTQDIITEVQALVQG